ncbi:MAG: IS256 family transposase [Candidatus Acidiferrum sp.]
MECKDFFESELLEQVRAHIKLLLETALGVERDRHLRLSYYEHAPDRLDYRNGFYFRDLVTQLGRLARVRIPRTRRGFRSELLPRRQQAVNELILQAFLRGVSTRQVGRVLAPVLGECYSAQTISRITRQLDAAVAQFHRRPLRDDYVYLFLDGVVLKMRDLTAKVRRRMVLVAYGVRLNGQREILDYRFAYGESEAAWLEFLQGLFNRGLEGKHLRLLVSDGGKGLRAALPVVFPQVPQQLCWAHKMRNIANKVGRHDGSCVAEAAAIYRARSRNEALRAFHQWQQHWQQRRPTAVACVEANLEVLLNFFDLPESHWRKIRTTNVIERAFREVRRRTRPMSSFTNLASCDRIIYGVITHLNTSWERKPFPKFTQTT